VAKKDKSKKENKEENHSPLFDFNFLGDLLKPIKLLFELHVKLALREFKRDSQRLLEGVVTLLSGCFFLFGFWILLNVLGIIALNEFAGFNMFFSVLIVAGINLFFALLLFILSRSKLKKSFFSESRKLFEDTFDDLK
jgi:hypothetical protein